MAKYDLYLGTPKFITDFIEYLRKLKIQAYKSKKIKSAKLLSPKNFRIYFDLVLRDKNGVVVLRDFDIVVPGQGIYFAKKDLRRHIKNNIDIVLKDFHVEETLS